VTGGTSGLGLAVAQRLVRLGAHVSIVARNKDNLATALESLGKNRISDDQILKSYSFSLDTAKAAAEAIEAASAAHEGRVPDAFFLCAGASKPMFYLEMTEEDHTGGMNTGYWLQAWSAFAAAKKLAQQGIKGRIAFVGSTLSYMSFVGYASYSPAKYALRGLSDALRSELLLYGITVQMFFPNTMLTPGYEEECKTRPKITSKIEDGDQPSTAEEAAKAMVDGVQKGLAHITCDFLTSLFRASSRGSTPHSNYIIDGVYDAVAYFAVPIWRRYTDAMVVAHSEEHAAYLKERKVLT